MQQCQTVTSQGVLIHTSINASKYCQSWSRSERSIMLEDLIHVSFTKLPQACFLPEQSFQTRWQSWPKRSTGPPSHFNVWQGSLLQPLCSTRSPSLASSSRKLGLLMDGFLHLCISSVLIYWHTREAELTKSRICRTHNVVAVVSAMLHVLATSLASSPFLSKLQPGRRNKL